MQAWNKPGTADLGDAVVDFGNPTGASKDVVPGGVVSDGTPGITGYSLISADSLDAAAEACRDHPISTLAAPSPSTRPSRSDRSPERRLALPSRPPAGPSAG